MSASDDYCDFCDLPRSQCIHGQPPPSPPAKPTTVPKATRTPKPKKRAPARASGPDKPEKPVTRRWTPPEDFKPLILSVLTEAGGALDAEDLFLELEVLAEDRLRPADSELTPEGELRWRYAARRARMALIEEGLMTKTRPGVWQLAPGAAPGRAG